MLKLQVKKSRGIGIIPGIDQIVFHQGNEKWRLTDNHKLLGRLPRKEALIDIYPSGDNVFVFTKMPNYNIRPGIQGATIHQKSVPIGYGRNGCLGTDYLNNNIRVLVVKRNAFISIWEVALVAQKGNFFATAQEVYHQVQLCLENGKIVVPQLSKWPQLAVWLNKILGDKKHGLPSVREYQPIVETVDISGLPSDIGVVKHFNVASGLGVIFTPRNGEACIHYSNFVNTTGIIWPQTGQKIHWGMIKEGSPLQEAVNLRW